MNKAFRLIVSAIVVVGLGVIVGPWAYINFIKDDAPAALDIDSKANTAIDSDGTAPAPLTDTSGDWQVSPNTDSVVGYRVKEILFGQATEGVGRTEDVKATLTIANNAVTAASFTVQMGTLMSDEARRDGQFNGRIMDVATHPTATFSLTQPIALPANAVSGEVITTDATGELTLRGTTKTVTFPVKAQVRGSSFTVVGNITIVFSEWSIPEPGLPGISVDPQGLLEFELVFRR
ncbi:MAG: YceI family protein [Acidobacteria bacterium]|nr:YceI family protein [Acidobacteriota bacterium]